jgi:tellurite resistance protein TehA-like permease
LVIGSLILARLFFGPTLPTPLLPTLAIEVAPAAVASLAYFAQHGDYVDPVVAFLAGYGVLMALAQLRLFPGVPPAPVHAELLGFHLQLGRRRNCRAALVGRAATGGVRRL